MRIEQIHPAALGRQLAEWRQPLGADPDLDAAVMRLLDAIERQPQRSRDARERKD